MNYRLMRWIGVPALSLITAIALPAQENQAKRLASIVGVATEEYAKAIDEHGKLISKDEFDETYGFLTDAREVAKRLSGYDAATTRAILDTMITAVAQKKPPSVVKQLQRRFSTSLGTAGAMDLPESPLDAVDGQALFVKNCASCHGEKGAGDGPALHTLSTPPPAIGIRTLTPELTPTLAYNVISVGVRGTAMPGFASSLTPQQRWNIINYIYSLRGERLTLPAARADATATPGDTASPVILALLDSALDFARNGKNAEAGDRAFDAYIAFEPLETPARAKKPGLVATMERHFADFKGAVRRNDVAAAKNSRDAIADGLPSVVDLSQQVPSGSWEAFLQSFLIIVREGFEAILVIGAVVALLIKTGHRERLRSIWLGIALGLVASAATAVAMKTLLAAMPASREIVEATSMLIAVVVLFSVSYWLISKVEAAKWQKFIREKVNSALEHGGGKALALVAFLAVYREGAETALFYQALFNEGPNVGGSIALGIVVGFVVLAVIFTLFYRYGVRIPMRPFFAVTSILLYYMAFVFMGKGIRELQEGNIMPITVIPGGPHIEAMGIYPSVETLTAQGILIVLLLFATIKTFGPGHKEEEAEAESEA
ncbi:MAG TPA: cytochrome c/FTR1 family iron permease [Gemmatimonadaceae bacterium]|nr:cytochrome c/FTR1 family iron permease [Gemmatimonadaceae bacterium]